LRILLVHPGASWSTHDVFEGLTYGLQQLGVIVVDWRLDIRIESAKRSLNAESRTARKRNPGFPRPTQADILYKAGQGIFEKAWRHQVDAILIVSGMFFHPDLLKQLKWAGLRVFVLLTESPYDSEKELNIARIVDGIWTNERTVVPMFREVTPHAGYIPHGWHPLKHIPGPQPGDDDVPQHDVVFVGSGFSERITFFNAIDWSGINLGLYGTWKNLGLKKALIPCIKGENIDNVKAAALYRRAKIGLNLYRVFKGWDGGREVGRVYGESLSPRAYELAACGVFSLSDYRAEVPEVFGSLVPTFRNPFEASALMRSWLADDAGRARVAAHLPACVAEASWVERSTRVLGDLQALLNLKAA
jgi:hypothetical protein